MCDQGSQLATAFQCAPTERSSFWGTPSQSSFENSRRLVLGEVPEWLKAQDRGEVTSLIELLGGKNSGRNPCSGESSDGAAQSVAMSAKKATAIIAVGNLLPPAAQLVTQAILARSLGLSGRGEAAAGSAVLLFGVATLTLGLPEALTFFVARGRPRLAREFVIVLVSLGLSGMGGMLLVFLLAPSLSGGSTEVARLMSIASIGLVPALWTAALRGAAFGAQQWWLIAGERSFTAFFQLMLVWGLIQAQALSPLTATVAITASSCVGGIVYLFSRRWWTAIGVGRHASPQRPRELSVFAAYASRVWLGSMAGIVLSRLDQLMMTPLAGVDELAIYVVAVNVGSAAMLFNSSVLQVVFALEAGQSKASRVGHAARISTAVTALVGIGLAALAPWAVPIVFGRDFSPAIPVIFVLLIGTVVTNPGSVAGATLSAWGNPGLRSISLVIAAVINVCAMLLLVPRYGAMGAAIATGLGSITASSLVIFWLRVRFGFPISELSGLRSSDLDFLQRRPVWLRIRPRVE